MEVDTAKPKLDSVDLSKKPKLDSAETPKIESPRAAPSLPKVFGRGTKCQLFI